MKSSSLAAALAVLLVGVAPGAAQDATVEQVNAQFQDVAVTLAADGYVSTHDVVTDALDIDEVGEITLGLFVTDSSGALIDSDTEMDDVPLVTFTPSRSGTFVIEVEMVDCEVGPCAYGVGVFGR